MQRLRRRWTVFLLLLVLLGGAWVVWASGIGSVAIPLLIQTIDGTVSGVFTTLKVTNTTLTNNGDGTATLNVGSGVGNGDVSSAVATTTNGRMVVMSGTGGKTVTEYTGTAGVVKTSASGVPSAATAGTDYVAPGGALGTPSSGTLTNATGLPISTGVSGLGTGVATALGTPSSANLASALTDETGSGSGGLAVFNQSPTLVTPTIGSFANAPHTHADAAGGGQLSDTAVGAANKQGTGTKFQMFTGSAPATNDCAKFDANGNVVTAGAACGTGGGGVWGSITGTLSDQTDLQSALDAKQASLGFTAENAANKTNDTTLATDSATKYPTEHAVKTYVDSSVASAGGGDITGVNITTNSPLTGGADCTTAGCAFTLGIGDVALGSGTSGNYVADVTAGAGLAKTSSASEGQTVDLALDSQEAGFLKDGGVTSLDCTGAAQGKMQVLDNGNLEYCDGATSSVLRTAEILANKSTDVALGTSNTLYPTQNAVKSYVDTAIIANDIPTYDTCTSTSGSLDIDSASISGFFVCTVTGNITAIPDPGGSPALFQTIDFYLANNGTSWTISGWNAIFTADYNVPLPTMLLEAGKVLRLRFEWNGAAWALIASNATSTLTMTVSTALPGTATSGQLYQDSDSGGSETYVGIDTDTWRKLKAMHEVITVSNADVALGPTHMGNIVHLTTGNTNRTATLPAAAAGVCAPNCRTFFVLKVDTGTGRIDLTYNATPGTDTLNGVNGTLSTATSRWAGYYVEELGNGGWYVTPTFDVVPAVSGGTGLSAATDDNIMVGNGTVWESKAIPDCDDTGGNHLNYDTATNAITCGTSGGASSISSATNHGIVVATGATTATSLGVATNGQLPIGSTGANPVLAALTGTSNRLAVTNGAGSITLNVPDSAQLSVAKLTNLTTNGFVKTGSSDGTLSVDTGNYIAASASSTVGQVLRVTGSSTYGFGAVDLADTDAVTGTLPAGNLPAATTSASGIAELATAAEVTTGTDTVRTITPDALATATQVRSIYIPAGSMDVSGTTCTLATSAALVTNGPKLPYITCTDSDTASIEFEWVMPDGWNAGTITVELIAQNTANNNTQVYELDFAGQCVRSGDQIAAHSTTGEQAATITWGNNTNLEQHATTAAITLNGTCAAGAHVYMRGQVDATATTVSDASTVRIIAVKVEYTRVMGTD